jgi:hypothetical protein
MRRVRDEYTSAASTAMDGPSACARKRESWCQKQSTKTGCVETNLRVAGVKRAGAVESGYGGGVGGWGGRGAAAAPRQNGVVVLQTEPHGDRHATRVMAHKYKAFLKQGKRLVEAH